MRVKSESLIEDLIELTKQNLNNAQMLKQKDASCLNWKENAESWSVLECIEHLNLYGDFYLPEIEQRIKDTRYKQPSEEFTSRFLDDYFAQSMLPKANLRKIKTFKDKNPVGSELNVFTLERFIDQQRKMLELLDSAKQVDLVNTKTAISISNLIKLKLGDTFRVVIYHNLRQLVQAEKVIGLHNEINKYQCSSTD